MTLPESIEKLTELLTKITPADWSTSECSNGGLLLLRPPFDGQRYAIQSHVQILPYQDAEFIALSRNTMPLLLAELQRLQTLEKDLIGKVVDFKSPHDSPKSCTYTSEEDLL